MGSLDWDHHFMRTLTKLLLYESMSHMNSSTTDKWFTRSMKFDLNFWESKPKNNQRPKLKCFIKLDVHLLTSEDFKNWDWSCQNGPDFPFLLSIVTQCYLVTIFLTNFSEDIFLVIFFDNFLPKLFTYNLLTIESFRIRVTSILFYWKFSITVIQTWQ